MEDFLRWMQPGVLAALGGLVVVFVGAWILKSAMAESVDPEIQDAAAKVNKWRNIVVVVLGVIFAWQIFAAASVNNVPRATIDRSDVNRQTSDRYADK